MNRFRTADIVSMLRRRIQWGMHLGLAKAGDRLQSLRAASAEFGVDQRSVLSAYRELEREGLVVLRPRSGIYIAGERAATQAAPAARWMTEMFLQGFARGVPPVSLGTTLAGALKTCQLTAACVECNADQILWMAWQLRHEFGMSTTWVETSALATDTMVERLRASDLIVTTAFHATEARRLGEEYELPVVVVTASRDEGTQIRAELGRGPVYFIGTDDRYVQKLLEAGDGARWMGNSRPITLDRLTPGTIPEGAPVVVTQAVAELMGENIPRGASVMNYPFSSDARSEIIAIMLSANLRAHQATPLPAPDQKPPAPRESR